jgi:murein L,D-transpeptidase YafK
MKRAVRLALGLAALIVAAGLLWSQLITKAPPPALVTPEGQIDLIVIEKGARTLTALQQGKVVLQLDVALGFAPEGDKVQEGDGKTPEGRFTVDRRNPQSAFHLSLGLDYPRPQDIARAKSQGVDPGSDIFIHGQPNRVGNLVTLPGDWTAGCIAVSNAEMETLWAMTPIGTPVQINP